IPAIGLSLPLDSLTRRWRFGLAAYGVSGLGVDYRSTSIDQPQFFDFGPFGKFPLAEGQYTSLEILKFAPALRCRLITHCSTWETDRRTLTVPADSLAFFTNQSRCSRSA